MENNNCSDIIKVQIDTSAKYLDQQIIKTSPVKPSLTRPASKLDHFNKRGILSPQQKRQSSQLNDLTNELNHSTSGVMSHDKIHQSRKRNVLSSQHPLKSSDAGKSQKHIPSLHNAQRDANKILQSFDTRDPVQKYGSYLESKSSKYFFKDQYGRIVSREGKSRQSSKSHNSGANEFSFLDNPQGIIQVNDKGSQFSNNSKVVIKTNQIDSFNDGNGQSPYFNKQGLPIGNQQLMNQEQSPLLAKTLSGQGTIEGNQDPESSKIKIVNNQDLDHLDLGSQNQNFIQHLQICSTSTQPQRDHPQQAQKNFQNMSKGKQPMGKSREQLAVNVVLLDGNVSKDGRLQISQDINTSQFSQSISGSGARTNENQKRQVPQNQKQTQQQMKSQHKLNVIVQNPSIQQEAEGNQTPQTDNMNFKNVHQSKKGQESEIQQELQRVENQATRDIILLKQFNKQVITDQIQKQSNNTDIMKSFDDIDSAFIRNKDHLKFLGQTENIKTKSIEEDDIIMQPQTEIPVIPSNMAVSSKSPQRLESDITNEKKIKDLENIDSSLVDSPYQKAENQTPNTFISNQNITRVNTLLLNAPSDANLLTGQTPGSGKGRGKGSQKFVIPSMSKSKRWLHAQNQQKQNSELKEESNSSFQDMVLKGYSNESPENVGQPTEFFELEQSSQQVNINKGSRNFYRKTVDDKPTVYADLVRKFISRSPSYGRRNVSKDIAKSIMRRYESKGKQSSHVSQMNSLEKGRGSANNIRPQQMEKIIKNSYKPLDQSSQVQKMIQRSKQRNKSYYHRLQEQKRSVIIKKSRTGSKIGRIEFSDIQPFDQAPQIVVQDQDLNYYRGDYGRKTASYFSKRSKLLNQQQSNRYRVEAQDSQPQLAHVFNPYNDPVSQSSPTSIQDQLYAQKPLSADASKYANFINDSQNLTHQDFGQNLNRRISSKDFKEQITETGMSHWINEMDSGVHLLSCQIQIKKNTGNFGIESSKGGDGVSALTQYENQLSSDVNKRSMLSSKELQINSLAPQRETKSRDEVSYMSGSKIIKNPLLGVMYQNVNRVLSIGDIDGVKGDPAENIREKGIFEQNVPFQLQQSQIEKKDCLSLKLMKLRRQCNYANGAIQYDRLNRQRDDKCLDEDHDQSLNYQDDIKASNLQSMSSRRKTLDQNSMKFQTSYGNNMFAQDGFSSRQSDELRFEVPSSSPTSHSIQKMKHLRRLKNKQAQYFKTHQTINRKSTAALILRDEDRYDIDRGQVNQKIPEKKVSNFEQFQNTTQESHRIHENQDQQIIEESIVETSRTKELMVAQTIDQGNQIFTPPSGTIKGDHLYQVRGYQSSLPQKEEGHFSNDHVPSLKMDLNEKSDLSKNSDMKTDNKPTDDSNLERNSSEITESKYSETDRLVQLVKERKQMQGMPTPKLETEKSYWMNQHNIHLQQIELEKASIFTHSKNFDFFRSPVSQNNIIHNSSEEKFSKKPGFSQTSYMGFKIPDYGQQQKMNKLRSLIKTANGPTTSSAQSLNALSLQKQTTKTSFQNARRLRNRRGDQSQGSNVYSSFNRNSSQDLKMKHGSGSAVSFASRPSTNHGQQKSSSLHNLRKKESLENKIKQIQKRSNLNFKKQNCSVLKTQAEKDHKDYVNKQVESITMMSSDALKLQTAGGENIVQLLCQNSLKPGQMMHSQPSEVLPGSHISRENAKVNIGVSTSMTSFGNIMPKFKGSSQHQESRKIDEYNQDISISYQPYDDRQNSKLIYLDNQGPPTEMNVGGISSQTPQPNLNTTKLSDNIVVKQKYSPKGTLINSSIVGSNEPRSVSEVSNVRIQDQQSTMMVVRQVTTDQEVQQIFIDVNQNNKTKDDQKRPSTADGEETVQTNEIQPSMAKRFSGVRVFESYSSLQKDQVLLENCPSKDEELKLTVEHSHQSLQKNEEQAIINQDLKQDGVETPQVGVTIVQH